MEVEVTYKLLNNELVVDMKGSLEAGFGEVVASPINMTNHSYFNLDGHDYANGVLDHELKIFAGAYTPTDAESIPTKEVHKFYRHSSVTDGESWGSGRRYSRNRKKAFFAFARVRKNISTDFA